MTSLEAFTNFPTSKQSIGGDSDTVGCITVGIAEAFYGIPKDLYDKGMAFLDENLRSVVEKFEKKFGNKVLAE
mgnify:CR=1 FL=1